VQRKREKDGRKPSTPVDSRKLPGGRNQKFPSRIFAVIVIRGGPIVGAEERRKEREIKRLRFTSEQKSEES